MPGEGGVSKAVTLASDFDPAHPRGPLHYSPGAKELEARNGPYSIFRDLPGSPRGRANLCGCFF